MTTIYKNNIKRKSSSLGGYGMFAESKIKTGEIISVDLMKVGNVPELVSFLDNDDSLRSRLHPRIHGVDTVYKVAMNTFEWEEPYALGDTMSFYNHSCKPNAMFFWSYIRRCKFGTVVAMRDINKNEEIRIYYGYEAAHDPKMAHQIQCKGCDTDKDTFVNLYRIACNMVTPAQMETLVAANFSKVSDTKWVKESMIKAKKNLDEFIEHGDDIGSVFKETASNKWIPATDSKWLDKLMYTT